MIAAWLALAGCGEPLPGPCGGRDARGFAASVSAAFGPEGTLAVKVGPTSNRVDAWTLDLRVFLQNTNAEPCPAAVYVSDALPDLSLVGPFDPAVPPLEEDPNLGRLLASALVAPAFFEVDTGDDGGFVEADGVLDLDVTLADGPAEAQWITVVGCEGSSAYVSAHAWSCDQVLEDRVELVQL